MIQVQIGRHFDVRTTEGRRLTAEDLHVEGERLMQALLDLEACNEDVSDAATATDATQGRVLVELLITADSEAEAVEKSLMITRTAIHAIGGATPWEAADDLGADYRPREMLLEYV
ncbi:MULTISPECIES: hypothetical protein [Micromonospora]|uniref:hypothetical protein n=1 Tax=Micromonospora TaxID=1873 RepID=UPI00068B4DB9|nr:MULTISPECIES: hypothetical protein [Micromonospora]MBC9001313.1 hypothetical protein [Micromonospora aurantiaca]MDG4749349.1 hypothetical protein [Micromonospora sp. WMMD718]